MTMHGQRFLTGAVKTKKHPMSRCTRAAVARSIAVTLAGLRGHEPMARQSGKKTGRRRKRIVQGVAELPIIDDNAEIIAWTPVAPEPRREGFFHEQAMRILGGIVPCYVDIDDPEAARRAGSPSNWKGPWRCLAICSEGLIAKHPRTQRPASRFARQELVANVADSRACECAFTLDNEVFPTRLQQAEKHGRARWGNHRYP